MRVFRRQLTCGSSSNPNRSVFFEKKQLVLLRSVNLYGLIFLGELL